MTRYVRPAVLGSLALLFLAVAACSSSTPQPKATSTVPASAQRYLSAPALLVQCAFDHGTLELPAGPSSDYPWLRGKKIVLDSSGQAGFTSWYQRHASGVTIGGKTIASWAFWAADNDRLPAAVCGPAVSAHKIARQVEPGDAYLWGT
jgi:hypothetical protein